MAISYSLHFQAPATVRNSDRSPARDGNCLFKHPLSPLCSLCPLWFEKTVASPAPGVGLGG